MTLRAFRSWLLPLSVFGFALLVLCVVSRLTGPAFDELAMIGGVDQKAELVKRIAARGFGELTLPETRPMLEPQPAFLGLVGAWLKLSLGRAIDPLTAERMPWLVLGAFAVLSLFAMVRPSRGPYLAVAAAFALLMTPRFVHAVVVRREPALVACLWLIVLALYLRSLGRGRTLCWSIGAAIALGFGVAQSFGTLWVLLLVVVHHALVRVPSTRRLLRRGRLPVPSFVLLALALAPVVSIAVSPGLWRQSGAGIARFVLSPLSPTIAKTEYAGKIVQALPVPGGFAGSWLLQSIPWLILGAAVAGILVAIHRSLARRFATGRLRPARDRFGLASLAMLGLTGVVVGPALAPDVLTTFPPRVEIALPFLAILAALGAERVTALAPSPRLEKVAVGLVAALLALITLSAPATLSAATSPLVGGAARIASSHALPLGDGSELGVLANAFDRLGSDSIALRAPPEVPPEIWEALRKSRRLRSSVGRGGATTLTLVRGKAPGSERGERIAEVKRDGAVLWTLLR